MLSHFVFALCCSRTRCAMACWAWWGKFWCTFWVRKGWTLTRRQPGTASLTGCRWVSVLHCRHTLHQTRPHYTPHTHTRAHTHMHTHTPPDHTTPYRTSTLPPPHHTHTYTSTCLHSRSNYTTPLAHTHHHHNHHPPPPTHTHTHVHRKILLTHILPHTAPLPAPTQTLVYKHIH